MAEAVRLYLRTLLRYLPRARRGHARAVHQARVASRRLREAVPVAIAAAPQGGRSEVGRDVRRVTDALGAVREMDVALEDFEKETRAHEWSPAVVQRVREHLENERARREREMRIKLARVSVKRLEARVNVLASAGEARAGRSWRGFLSARLRKRALRFSEALRAAGTLYAAGPIHEVRIAGKKLRYTLELARRAAGAPVGREVAVLKRLQDLLGRLRELQVLQEHVHLVAANAAYDVTLTRALDDLHEAFEAECRALHGRFLRRLDPLLALAERVSQSAAVPVAAGTGGRMVKLHTVPVRRPPAVSA